MPLAWIWFDDYEQCRMDGSHPWLLLHKVKQSVDFFESDLQDKACFLNPLGIMNTRCDDRLCSRTVALTSLLAYSVTKIVMGSLSLDATVHISDVILGR